MVVFLFKVISYVKLSFAAATIGVAEFDCICVIRYNPKLADSILNVVPLISEYGVEPLSGKKSTLPFLTTLILLLAPFILTLKLYNVGVVITCD